MPIREYWCKECGKIIEKIVYTKEPKVVCCGKECERIVFSRPSPPKLEGAGFYENDYKQKC